MHSRIEFPVLVTLSVARQPNTPVFMQPVFNAIDVRRNPYALELRLVNTAFEGQIDPYPFFIPRDPGSLRQLARCLLEEAEAADKPGCNPFLQ